MGLVFALEHTFANSTLLCTMFAEPPSFAHRFLFPCFIDFLPDDVIVYQLFRNVVQFHPFPFGVHAVDLGVEVVFVHLGELLTLEEHRQGFQGKDRPTAMVPSLTAARKASPIATTMEVSVKKWLRNV